MTTVEPMELIGYLRELADVLKQLADYTLEYCADEVLLKYGETLSKTARVLSAIRDELAKTPRKELATPIVGAYGDECPNCGVTVERQLYGEAGAFEASRAWSYPVQYEVNYCPECGQKLLWED